MRGLERALERGLERGRAINGTPTVLIASVSAHEGQLLERVLEKTGWTLVRVEDADDAARQLDGAERQGVLVIDAGLLEMAHDPQWRLFRERHPDIGTVVRCLVRRTPPPPPGGGRTLRVHPDDIEGVRAAVLSLYRSGAAAD